MRFFSINYLLFGVFLSALLFYGSANSSLAAKNIEPLDSNKINPEAEEVPMQVNIELIGTININVFTNENDVYIPIFELFRSLKIDCNLVRRNFIARGFFVKEENPYYINVYDLWAEINEKEIELKRSDFYVDGSDLYMRSSLYKEFFGIDLNIDLKRLSIYMKSKEILPITLEEQRKYFREKSEPKKFDTKSDVYISRNRKLLGLGFLDWQISYSHNKPDLNDYNYNFTLGSEVAGGDFIGNFTGRKDNYADWNNSNFRWRYVAEENWFKQGLAGDINFTSGLFSSTQGIQITNAPPITRKLLGGYKIFDQISPNWDVELYVNNQLLGYTKASETGYFEFNIPLLYGSNFITLKYYGPSGEMRTSQRVIQAPYTFLPAGEFEYYLSGGKIKTDKRNEVTEASFNWGATSFLTLGAGNSYINESSIRKNYPNANISLKVLNSLIFSGQYFANLKGRASLNLILPSQISAEFNFIRYEKNSFFNPGLIKEEKNLSLFLPVSFGDFFSNFRLNMREMLTSGSKFLFVYPGLFINYGRFQSSVSINSIFQREDNKYKRQYLGSSFLFSYRMFDDLLLRQQTDIDNTKGQVTKAGFYIDKSVFGSGWISLSLSRDFLLNSYSGGINFRFDLPFTRASTDYSTDKSGWSVQQSFYGSIGFDDFKHKFITDNKFLSSRSGLSLVPFLDINNNDILDDFEKELDTQLEVNMESGQAMKYTDEKNIWFSDLDPYDTYHLEINPMTFDNPLFRPKYKTYSVYTDPGRFKPVPIPVYITGSVSGYVNLIDSKGTKGIAGIDIILEAETGKTKLIIPTFSDGEFIFDNVPPGKYRLYLDPDGLAKRKYKSETKIISIEIKSIEEGDTINNIEFILKK